MAEGTIFDIKEFAVYDGPGMRQTVFFKGCPLRCNWCHNPEGLSCKPELMVSTASCVHCRKCAAVCTHQQCVACGECVKACPQRLRKLCGETLTATQLVQRIRENSAYYAAYGGGVTFSGGEPLMQPEFLLETLEALPELHKAIETSGYTDPQTFCRVIDALDYVMMDLKLADSKLHKAYTGIGNGVILGNLRLLIESGKPFVIRIPVIPGVNDTAENYRATARLLQGAHALEKVELLPYHKTAGAKYNMVGRTYEPLFDIGRSVQISQSIFEDYGIRSSVL